MKQTLLVLTASLILFAGCKKEDKLPTPTHSGANTFACKIDGKVFSVSGVIGGAITDGVFLGGGGGSLKVIAQEDRTSLDIGFPYPINIVPRTTSLGKSELFRGTISIYRNGNTMPSKSTEYKTNDRETGVVTITHLTNEYVSGTFAYDAINGEGTIVHITEGNFDIEF